MKTRTVWNMLRKLVLVLAIGLLPVSAYCGTVTGTIVSILYYVPTPNFVFVYMSASSTGTPACVNDLTYANRMTLDLSVPAGKAMYAHLLAIRLTNPTANITLVGSGACTAWPGTENIQLLFL